MLFKNFNCSDVCSFMPYIVYVQNKDSHIVGRTQIVWVLKTGCRKEYFSQEVAGVGRKYIMRSLIILVIYNILLG